MATIFGDETAKGGLGEVLHGVRMLKGQALAFDWMQNGHKSPINTKGLAESLKQKLMAFEGE